MYILMYILMYTPMYIVFIIHQLYLNFADNLHSRLSLEMLIFITTHKLYKRTSYTYTHIYIYVHTHIYISYFIRAVSVKTKTRYLAL